MATWYLPEKLYMMIETPEERYQRRVLEEVLKSMLEESNQTLDEKRLYSPVIAQFIEYYARFNGIELDNDKTVKPS